MLTVTMNKFELKLRRRDIPEADILADLRRVVERLNVNTITKAMYDEYGVFGATTILRRFGSWNKALNAAGLSVNNRINIPDEELFENLANVWQTLGRQPVGNDIAKTTGASKFSLGTYEKRFGSWNKSLIAFVQYVENPKNQKEISIDPESSSLASGRRTPRKINWRLRATVLIRNNCICQMCGASPAKDASVSLHIDHINPWSKGGETVLENLQTLCSICNIGKSDEIFE